MAPDGTDEGALGGTGAGPDGRDGPEGVERSAEGAGPEGAGGLPEAAGRRLGAGAWSSGLSMADFAASVDLGMEQAGFVQGFAVMQLSSSPSGLGPGAGLFAPSGYGMTAPWSGGGARGGYSEQWQCPHMMMVSADHATYGYNVEQAWAEESWQLGWTLAFDRMVDEARVAGAHGVIGVVDDRQTLVGAGTVEFRFGGTAVRIPGAPLPETPFSTFLSGRRLAKLIEAGYVPVGVVAALSSVLMVGYCITRYQMAGSWSSGMGGAGSDVQSIDQVNRAQRAARHLARERVRKQLGGDVLHGATLEEFEQEIGEGALSVQSLVKGTRVRPFKAFAPLDPPEPVVRLR